MQIKKTERGFEYIEFKDIDGNNCSLQQSHLAIYEEPGTSAIWLGTEKYRMLFTFRLLDKYLPILQRWLNEPENERELVLYPYNEPSIKIKDKSGLQSIEFSDSDGNYCELNQAFYGDDQTIKLGIIEGDQNFQMHLTFKLLNQLVPILHKWIELGRFDEEAYFTSLDKQ